MSDRPILLQQGVPLLSYRPRALLNGFPKAGLHMLEQMVRVILAPSQVGRGGSPWIGTYKWSGWSMLWQDMRHYLWRLSCLERGTYLKGHNGYHADIANLLRYGNIAHIFLFRDLRDVAVSQAHHIWDKNTRWQHEHKDLYRALGSYDAVLMAVIEGLGPYPGVVERWAEYAPWLENEHALRLEYSQMRGNMEKAARVIALFLIQKATELLEGANYGVEIAHEEMDKLAKRMVAAAEQPSLTLRKGVSGGWQDDFTEAHIEAFKRSDKDGWLVRLGFEENEDWGV